MPQQTPPIAEKLAESQKSISIAEFFEKNKQMLGFDSPHRSLITMIKEAVDNALDACEEAGILPDLFREGQGIIATGKLENNIFMASEILAKHDENYMPPEVAATLKVKK